MPAGRPKGSKTKAALLSSPAMIAKWREGVAVTLIRNRLQKHALGELKIVPNTDGVLVDQGMTQTQLAAAKLLLERCLPTVASVEMTGKDGGPLESRVTFYLPKNGRD